MMPMFRFAIIDANVLTGLGLQQILKELLPMADIVVCQSFDELERAGGEDFLHYFVSSRILFEHS